MLREARSLLQSVNFEGKDDDETLREAHQLLKRVSFASDVKEGSPWLRRARIGSTGLQTLLSFIARDFEV